METAGQPEFASRAPEDEELGALEDMATARYCKPDVRRLSAWRCRMGRTTSPSMDIRVGACRSRSPAGGNAHDRAERRPLGGPAPSATPAPSRPASRPNGGADAA